MIDVQSLTHRYPKADTFALQDLSFTVKQGECLGLLGPNGAGKTTLMSLLCGLQEVQQGAVLFDGVPLSQLPREKRQKIGLVPQDFAFYPQLTVWDNMLFFASLYHLRDKVYLSQLLETAGLTAYRNRAAKHLSGGLKRRLNFAIGLINRPELIFLDEITVGIDPQSRRFILDSVAALTAQGVTVIYTSHYLQEIEQLCSEIALLSHGKLIYHGGVQAMLQQQSPHLRIQTRAPIPTTLQNDFGLTAMADGYYEGQGNATYAFAVYQAVLQTGAEMLSFQHGHGSLETFYLDFLAREAK